MATTFGWKRKTPHDLSRKRPAAFIESEDKDKDFLGEPEEQRSGLLSKRSREEKEATSRRLMDEGISFAEQNRYSKAIRKWNEALKLTPNDERIHEMKSQVFLQIDKTFEAIKSAEKAVELNPRWPAGYQSLGRAQLKYGELDLAVYSFSKAFHLRPDDLELLKEDLMWSVDMREKARTYDKLMASK